MFVGSMLSVPLISLQPKCKTEWRCRSSMPTIMVTSTCRLTVGWSGRGTGRGGLCPYKDHFALRPQKQGGLLGAGTGGGGGGGDERVKARPQIQLHLPPLRSLDLLISPGTLPYKTIGSVYILCFV